MTEYKHGEAFMLMQYRCACGHAEVIWNSRDGVTPFIMPCPSCGDDLAHVNWRGDVRSPEHIPNYGQGVWRDGTPDEAEAILRERIARFPDGLTEDCIAKMVCVVRNPDDESNTEFRRGWPMFFRAKLNVALGVKS